MNKELLVVITNRRVSKILKGKPIIEGAGVHLKRAFGYSEVPAFDPFLLLDDFHSSNPVEYLAGFPWHPHRGIETITYILQGRVEHSDSMGNKGVIGAGEVQWMTAGSGIIHQEMPQTSPTGMNWGFQLWANLPAADKMMAPRYRDVKASDIPEVVLDSGAKIKIISGEVQGIQGPVRDIVTDPKFLDVWLPVDSTFTHAVESGYTVFVYVYEGEGYFDDADQQRVACGPENVVLFEQAGNQICVKTKEQAVRFLLLSGKPLNEPVAWRGPIVMNTKEELQVAFDEYQSGNFIK
jgi:hypothetical protein